MNETLQFDLIAMEIYIKEEEEMHISLPHRHPPIPQVVVSS